MTKMFENILNLTFAHTSPFTYQECDLQPVWTMSHQFEMDVVWLGFPAWSATVHIKQK